MHTRDAARFAAWMTAMGELYGKAITGPLSELYWNALAGFEAEAVHAAFQAHISNPNGGQFMPKPADIVRHISGTAEVRGLEAWTKVTTAIRRHGAYESVVFDDPCIPFAIEAMGGWVALCATTLDALPFRAREFQTRYLRYLEKGPSPGPVPVLQGLLARSTALPPAANALTHIADRIDMNAHPKKRTSMTDTKNEKHEKHALRHLTFIPLGENTP